MPPPSSARCYRRSFVRPALILLALQNLISLVHAQATTTLYVRPLGVDSGTCINQASPCLTIQYALNQATTTGTEIMLFPGTYSGTGNFGLTFPGKTVNITGMGGSGSTFIDGSNTNQIFRLVSNEAGWVNGVTVTRGRAASGGCALYRGASLSFLNSVFHECIAIAGISTGGSDGLFAEGGGAVYVLNSNPRFKNVTFQFNRANQAAASAWLDNGATAVFEDCIFQHERAESFGGSVVPEGTSDSRFYNCKWNGCFSKFGGSIDTGSTSTTEFWNIDIYNSTGQRGGAIYHYNTDRVKIYNSRIYNNTAETNGGGIVLSISVGPQYWNCSFWDNIAGGVGGAVYLEANSNGTFRDSVFHHNRAPGGGGAIFGRGSVILNSLRDTFRANSGIYGSAFLFEDQSQVVIDQANCVENTSELDGACIKIQNNVQLNLRNSNVTRNVANTEGGGIALDSNVVLTVYNCTFQENSSTNSRGGAIHIGGAATATMDLSTIKGNRASRGAGIEMAARSVMTITNSVIVGNVATLGGGIYTLSAGGVVVSDSVFDANEADFGAAIFFDSTASPKNNFYNRGIIRNHRAKAGAAFFYNVWSRLLTYSNTATLFSNNSALYGEEEATKPYRMTTFAPMSTGYSPKDRFTVHLKLIDYFGNVAVDTPDQVIVTLEGRGGLQVESSILRQGFQVGEAKFDSVIVYGVRDQTYTLVASSRSLPTLSFPVTIISCGPGYEPTLLDSNYRCTQCSPGTYSLEADQKCKFCPTGADCTAGGNNITAMEGFWLDPSSVQLLDPKLYRCSQGNCIGQSQCAQHRVGRLCSQCELGFSEWNKECQDCSSENPSWMLVPLLTGIVYSGLLIRFQRLTEAGIPKSMVFFIQASLILVTNDNRNSAQSVFRTFNLAFDWIINLDYRNKCVLNLNPLQRLAYEFYAPITPLLGLVFIAISMKLYHVAVVREPMTAYWNWRVIAGLVWVLLWGYIMIAKASFSLLNCIRVGSDTVLAAAPTVICGSPEHVPYQALAWTLVVCYILGLPTLCLYLLSYARKRLVAEPNYPLVKELYKAFQPSMWYYEIVLTLRKLTLTLLDVFLSTTEAEHSMALCVFFYVIFVIQYATQPFKNRLFNRAEDFLLMTLILMSGLSMGDTMRTNYLSTIDLIGVSYAFTSIGIFVVLSFILALTETGSRWFNAFVRQHPILARSINNITVIKDRVAAIGSTYSISKTTSKGGSEGRLSHKSSKYDKGFRNSKVDFADHAKHPVTNVAAMTQPAKDPKSPVSATSQSAVKSSAIIESSNASGNRPGSLTVPKSESHQSPDP